MRNVTLVTLSGVLALSLGSCALLPGGGGDEISETPDAGVPLPTEPAPAAQPFSEPVVTEEGLPTGQVPSDLIGSTNASQRVQGIQRDRPDPFALLPANPTIQTSPTAQAPQTIPQLPNLPNPSQQQQQPIGLAPLPNLVPQMPGGGLTPPQPQATLARSVAVSGVVQVGNIVYAIVDAPNEPSSRYVRAGQSLSNGQILVKRIEMNSGLEPIVILEQNGIEVGRAVGDGVATEETAAAALQLPPVAYNPAM